MSIHHNRGANMNANTNTNTVSCRITHGRDLGGCLAVTVDTARLLHLRKAIARCGAKDVGIVRATPLACGTRVRLLIAARPESFACVSEAIHRAFPDRDTEERELPLAA
jgi:hypothetical protein